MVRVLAATLCCNYSPETLQNKCIPERSKPELVWGKKTEAELIWVWCSVNYSAFCDEKLGGWNVNGIRLRKLPISEIHITTCSYYFELFIE